jgi:ABC-type molybdate transport system permease subunit
MAQAVAADPQLAGMMAPLQDLARQIHILAYAILMIIAPAGPGLLALYYLSRRRHIQTYLQQTPQWIVELERAGVRV